MFSLPVYRSDLDARWHILPTLCCVFLLYSHRFRLDNPCVFPRITPMSPSMCSIPPGKNPSLDSLYRSTVSLLSINLPHNDRPTILRSFPIGNVLDLVIFFRFGNPLLGFASFVPMRLFPRFISE